MAKKTGETVSPPATAPTASIDLINIANSPPPTPNRANEEPDIGGELSTEIIPLRVRMAILPALLALKGLDHLLITRMFLVNCAQMLQAHGPALKLNHLFPTNTPSALITFFWDLYSTLINSPGTETGQRVPWNDFKPVYHAILTKFDEMYPDALNFGPHNPSAKPSWANIAQGHYRPPSSGRRDAALAGTTLLPPPSTSAPTPFPTLVTGPPASPSATTTSSHRNPQRRSNNAPTNAITFGGKKDANTHALQIEEQDPTEDVLRIYIQSLADYPPHLMETIKHLHVMSVSKDIRVFFATTADAIAFHQHTYANRRTMMQAHIRWCYTLKIKAPQTDTATTDAIKQKRAALLKSLAEKKAPTTTSTPSAANPTQASSATGGGGSPTNLSSGVDQVNQHSSAVSGSQSELPVDCSRSQAKRLRQDSPSLPGTEMDITTLPPPPPPLASVESPMED